MEVGGAELTIYDNVDLRTGERVWGDLCRGPHLPTTRLIAPNAFKVMRSSAAYWLGNQANEQLQRIYGTAWPDKDGLRGHLAFLEEAAKRDHRRLGIDLDLFSFPDEVGSGLAAVPPEGRHDPPDDGGLLAPPARGRRATSSCTPRTSPRRACSRPRGTSTGTPTACTRRCTSTRSATPRATSAAPARTTTSSR